ncbi:MAG: hypothetical protein KGK01_03845 [Bradyrhizobium sp.]|nr:hypothetical protein [Bradyrhizobium sp.]MDE2241593.1 hypothetical protein [Bradyrhizobium sp.]MDE2469154.1 hypothetical protein [Bradyrhizobium sp.]
MADLAEDSADRITDRIANRTNRGDWTANAPGVMDASPTVAHRRMVGSGRPNGDVVRSGAHTGLTRVRAENDCRQ